MPVIGRARFVFRAAGSHTDASWGTSPFSVKRIRTGQSHRPDVLRETPERAWTSRRPSHAPFDWTLTQRSLNKRSISTCACGKVQAKTCPTATRRLLLHANTRPRHERPATSAGQAGQAGGSRRVFKHFAWLEVCSVKIALPRPAPPDRACRDHQRVSPTGTMSQAVGPPKGGL
jgi:hypothetical protein